MLSCGVVLLGLAGAPACQGSSYVHVSQSM